MPRRSRPNPPSRPGRPSRQPIPVGPETIAALATPPGRSGLALVRLSGPACREAAARHLAPAGNLPDSHRMYHAAFRDPATGEVLDRLNFVFQAAPRTATGEDSLEIFPHGNPILIRRILDALLAAGDIRLAEPGE